jgi:dissimilatory sulfite reductase (desulfoviridin) alpha/beta subunit
MLICLLRPNPSQQTAKIDAYPKSYAETQPIKHMMDPVHQPANFLAKTAKVNEIVLINDSFGSNPHALTNAQTFDFSEHETNKVEKKRKVSR